MKIVAIIPARYASSRFPGKPLIDIAGVSMIERVYKQVSQAINNVVVATDDDRIAKAVLEFGGEVVITGEHHKSGTDRCAEAVGIFEKKTDTEFDVVLNIQGDEPLINPEQISQLANLFNDKNIHIGTLVKPINDTNSLFNPDKARVIINLKNEAIYFTRATLPYIKNVDKTEWLNRHTYYQHIGLYGYRKNVLNEIVKLPQSSFELLESLEQLRWIENGYRIKVAKSDFSALSIDTPQDLEDLLEYMKNNGIV